MPLDDGGLVRPDEHSSAMLSWYADQLLQRKSSLPNCSLTAAVERNRTKSAPGEPPSLSDTPTPARRRGFSLARPQSAPIKIALGKSRRRKVTFKNMYTPDVVPAPKVESYDELVFNVAGLFYTTSFLHDPEDWGDPVSISSEEEYDPEPPLERSVPLMIAEFLYRSAVYLGYRGGETPWLPGFREDKRFSGNDVKRWRRLAHFDWESEEQEFAQTQCAVPTRPQLQLENSLNVDANWHNSVLANVSTTLGRQDSNSSVDSISSSSTNQSQDSTVSGKRKTKFRSAMSGWIRKHRHSRRHQEPQRQEPQLQEERQEQKQHNSKHQPVSWLDPPPISPSKDLELLVDIINSCVYCGHFRFRKRDIVTLCNVKI